MGNLKKSLLLGVLVPTAAAALVGYFAFGANPKRLLLDAALALTLTGVVVAVLYPTEKKVGRIADALRALARGEKYTRVQPEELGALSDLGHAVNEVGAFMVEGEDPNLGPIQSKPRPRPRHLEAPTNESMHPELSPPRKLKREPEVGEPRTTPKRGSSSPAASASNGKAPSQPAKEATPAPAPTPTPTPNDTSLEHAATVPPMSVPPMTVPPVEAAAATVPPAPAAELAATVPPVAATAPPAAAKTSSTPAKGHKSQSPKSAPPADAAPQLPTAADIEALFNAFVSAKKSQDQSVADLQLDKFAETIKSESERLLAAHQCKGVRFEITTQDGEVSLRPRLMR